MGIADFGVSGQGASAAGYEYATTAFQGQARVTSMSLTVSGTSSRVAAFELNEVLYLQLNGTNYSYWIQNGLHLDASSHEYTIGGAYVWNFSSAGARLATGELSGAAGSILGSDSYYYVPGCSAGYKWDCSTLSLPANLTGRVITGVSGGVPFVDYEYNIGLGWVTYDNVSFPHMNGAHDAGFLVDGFAPTPYTSAAYYDAEWVWVGAGGGVIGVDQGSDILLTLDYWNGHNYQAIPNAWNFGSNTGERNSNVTEALGSSPPGVPGSVVTSGAGTLGMIYNASNVGFVNVSGPTKLPETIRIDGLVTTFSGGWANLTLQAGTYSISLENYTNDVGEFTVTAGSTTFYSFNTAGELDFIESGLPTLTQWGVSVNGTLLTTLGPALVFYLPNGTYSVTYQPVPGFHLLVSLPQSVSLPGSTSIAVNFAQTTYPVAVVASGLPTSTPWSITVNGTTFDFTGAGTNLSLPNGSVAYTIGVAYRFVADPSNGTITVSNGLSSPVTIQFSLRTGTLAGAVSPSNATVAFNGTLENSPNGQFALSVLPGVYEVSASARGFVRQSEDVNVTPGNTSWTNFTLVPTSGTPSNATSPTPSGATGISPAVAIALIAVVAIVGVSVVAIAVMRRRR